MTRGMFLKRKNWFSNKAMARNLVRHSAIILLALFFAMRYVKDSRYFPEDETLEDDKLRNELRITLSSISLTFRPARHVSGPISY